MIVMNWFGRLRCGVGPRRSGGGTKTGGLSFVRQVRVAAMWVDWWGAGSAARQADAICLMVAGRAVWDRSATSTLLSMLARRWAPTPCQWHRWRSPPSPCARRRRPHPAAAPSVTAGRSRRRRDPRIVPARPQ